MKEMFDVQKGSWLCVAANHMAWFVWDFDSFFLK